MHTLPNPRYNPTSQTHLQSHTSDPSTCICTYFASRAHKGRIVGPTEINTAVKQAVTDLGLARNGLGSHSLHAGGAMAMHLNNISHDTIKKMGRGPMVQQHVGPATRSSCTSTNKSPFSRKTSLPKCHAHSSFTTSNSNGSQHPPCTPTPP